MSAGDFSASDAAAPLLRLTPMEQEDLDAVVAIENTVYPYPWTRGNFEDALDSGYLAWVARGEVRDIEYAAADDATGKVWGYFLLMVAVDEGHLLNISVRADLHRRGIGRELLDRVASMARELGLTSVLLEVRPSNTRAIAIYGHYGFVSIGRRKAYYPAEGNTREDAIVMRLPL